MLQSMFVLVTGSLCQANLLQMSEEIENADVNVPWAIFTTMILNGATGFAMMIAVLFCLGDIATVIVSGPFISQKVISDPRERKRQPDFPLFKYSTTGPDLMLGRQLWHQLWLASFGAP